MASESARRWQNGPGNSMASRAICEHCGVSGMNAVIRMSYKLHPVNLAAIRVRMCTTCRRKTGFAIETVLREEMVLDGVGR